MINLSFYTITMQAENFINYIEKEDNNFYNLKDLLSSLDLTALTQQAIINILNDCLINDKYILITKTLWPLIEDEDGLKKYKLYCQVLEYKLFNEKTARYICLKERYFKILNTSLLNRCGTKNAVDFLMNAYSLDVNNIISAIATCSLEEQLPIMKYLLSELNNNQKNLAINKFMAAYKNKYYKHVSLVLFMLEQKDNWDKEIIEDENIQKMLLYHRIDKALLKNNIKNMTNKI